MASVFRYFQIKPPQRAQALVEFVFVAPILVTILLGAFYVGMALYLGENAASAIQEPISQKILLANVAGETEPLAKQLILESQAGNQTTGDVLDELTFEDKDHLTALMVGKKAFKTPFSVFHFTVLQGINSNLLVPSTGSNRVDNTVSPKTTVSAPSQQTLSAFGISSTMDFNSFCTSTPANIAASTCTGAIGLGGPAQCTQLVSDYLTSLTLDLNTHVASKNILCAEQPISSNDVTFETAPPPY